LIEQSIIPPAEDQEAAITTAESQMRTVQDPKMGTQSVSLDSVVAALRAETSFGQPASSQSLDNDRQEPTFAPRRSQ
jgi:hypothetical protein